MPYVARITIHPVKGLEGTVVGGAGVWTSGALENDRRWRLVDADGVALSPGRCPRLRHVRAEFDLPAREICLRVAPHEGLGGPAPGRFPLHPGPDGPGRWLSTCLGIPVTLEERPEGGYPDDPDAPGPSIAAVASLEEVARWFSLPLDDVRRRCRVGVEIDGCDPFWEDTLASPARPTPALGDVADLPVDPWAAAMPPEPRRFRLGNAGFGAVGVRRLDEASRDPATGRATEHFGAIFEAWRRRRLRRDVDVSAWDGLYRLAITTIGDGRGGNVQVGDRLDAGRPP